MTRPADEWLIDACRKRRLRQNIMLILATRGGDASVAYRIGRAFQKIYKITERKQGDNDGPEFIIFIPTLCKSAGTILATAATKIVMSDFAELGPIEVQLRNPAEVGERTSSLAPVQALDSLKRQSKSLFEEHFKQLRFNEALSFSTKMAAEIASKLTVGLLSPIYSQVDPIRLAEVERSLKISGDYSERLAGLQNASNLKEGAAERLLGGYPSHGFVIDAQEAKELFNRVDEPNAELLQLLTNEYRWITKIFLESDSSPYAHFLSDEPDEPDEPGAQKEQNDGGHTRESAEGKGKAKSKVRKNGDAKESGSGAPSNQE